MMQRRGMLKAGGVALAMMACGVRAQGAAKARIVLLGTAGGPPPHLARSQPATLLEVGGKRYLIDAGENAGQQLLRAGVQPSKVDLTLLTHLHWDHTLGLDYLMATGWMLGRSAPMPIWGPPGTRKLVERTASAIGVGEDIFRAQAAARPPLASLYPPREWDVTAPQVLSDADGIKISAVANSHFAEIRSAPHDYGVDKAYAYRFDTPAGSVVFTGDTGPSSALAELAKGADVLVSEIVDLESIRAGLVANGTSGAALDILMQHMAYQHLTPEALGAMASAAGVKKLVLTHFVMGKGGEGESLLAPLRRAFPKGEIILGRDLLEIPL
ncbi:MBL fold metallo-hydrolase [Novosphingobium sediminicola]|uniref:Ribonuclease BN (tRNA processing enzyme) n=1 Tax=Novosphingobium sediminicola TaxID=563162 RepID=A0A7W6G5R4_9SPHN|nr:MBL fold metallo-hydrolase [Novosphingobium sediminicola]MBB3954370.1 ribonuclease BN (tRNA processing enzyme) [Novosphingobium sediminicola]